MLKVRKEESGYISIKEFKSIVMNQSHIICLVWKDQIAFMGRTTGIPFENQEFWFTDLHGDMHTKTKGWDEFVRRLSFDRLYIFEGQKEFFDFVAEKQLTIKA